MNRDRADLHCDRIFWTWIIIAWSKQSSIVGAKPGIFSICRSTLSHVRLCNIMRVSACTAKSRDSNKQSMAISLDSELAA
jgi:hypothetical protein